jgi:parallel beta-helix repeat protein
MRKISTILLCFVVLANGAVMIGQCDYHREITISNITYINGDLIVNNAQIRENETIVLTGNLVVEFGGNLTFNNVTLMMNCTSDGQYHIEVLSGGSLYICDYDDDNTTTGDASNITAYNPSYEYLFWVREGSNFSMRNSELHECGYNGPGLEKKGLLIETSKAKIKSCILSNNYYGNVLWHGELEVINSRVEFNEAMGLWAPFSNMSVTDTIISNNPIGMQIDLWSNATIVYSTFKNNVNALNVQYANKIIVENNNFSFNTEDAIYILGEVGRPGRPTIINNTLFDNDKGIVCGGRGEPTIINSTIMATWTDDLEAFGESHITTINTTFNKSRVAFNPDTSNLTVKWYLHTYVNNTYGYPIPNANIRFMDNSNGTYDRNFTTNANGYLNWTVLREYYQTQSTLTDYSPYNITASKPGYLTAYAEVEMNESKYITLTLQVDDEPPKLNHTPVTSARINEPISITVNVTDNMEVSNVTFYYQNVGSTAYASIDIALVSGNWTTIIPAQTETGLVHYFIWANDTSGNNITSPIMGDYAIQITGPPSIAITSPKGGEDWTGGSQHNIEFIASDTEDAPAILDVFLNYTSVSAGGGFIAKIKGDASPYDWTLPIINAIDVKINTTIVDSDGNKAYAVSPFFAIDSSQPEVIYTNPANNTTGISIFQPIVIQFNEKMNISSIVINQTSDPDPGGWQWFWNVNKDTFTGTHNAWLRGENVKITVQTGYKDYSNPWNANNTAFVFSFTTETNPSPEIVHINISGQQELGNEIRINATITDDETVMNAVLWWRDVNSIWHENYMQKNGNVWEFVIPGQMKEGVVRYQINATDDLKQKNTTVIYEFDIEDTTAPVIVHTPIESAVIGEAINITCQVSDLGGVDIAYIYYKNESAASFTQVTMNPGFWFESPAHSVPARIEYYIRASDMYGNDALTQTYSLETIDLSIPDTTLPEILFVSPSGNNVPILTSISIIFSESVNQTSVESAISISPTITGISYNWLDNQTLTIEIPGNLSFNTTYSVKIDTGAKDLAGNTLTSDYSWQFTTAEEPKTIQTPASNDLGWIGIIILLVTIIMLMLFYLFNNEKKEKELDNIKKEP